MGIINKLDISVANLIAAGEVVDRPASVIKELLENAADAGAKNITVEIKRGGSALIRVTDDGCGMSRDDVPVSILRHATSKVKTAADLDGITTLGFRGEALAAIASVSHIRIYTRRECDELGTLLSADGGEVTEITETGAQKGTTVIVEELFANVPARRKFLKRDASESMACSAVCEKLALSRPDISFKFISDGALRFSTDGKGSLKNAIYAVLGREFAFKLIEVHAMSEGVSVDGYIGSPDNIRANRNYQNFFINSRYVKSKTVMSAVEQAYDSFIPSDKFPVCVLYIKLFPGFVDVNVHPTKLEVKFSNERMIFDAVYAAVRNTLYRSVNRPEAVITAKSVSAEDIRLAQAFVPIRDRCDVPEKKREQGQLLFSVADSKETDEKKPVATDDFAFKEAFVSVTAQTTRDITENNAVPSGINEPAPAAVELKGTVFNSEVRKVDIKNIPEERRSEIKECGNKIEYRIIGEVFNAYVIVETEDKMLLIDKHAAHERIIFEQMKKCSKENRGSTQMLMMPTRVALSATEYSALMQYRPELINMGFDLAPNEKNHSFDMLGYPSDLTEQASVDMLTVLAEQLSSGTGSIEVTKEQAYEKALYQASCKAAIKAGHIENEGHIKWICDNLLALPDIMYCPHGRPVAMELSERQIEHQFKRS